MSDLNRKQAEFAYHVATLIVRARDELGIHCVGAEWYRTPEQAKIYAAQGKGITKSNHIVKLALDIFCLDANGAVTWDMAPYEKLGALWKTMHPLARWGGDFKGRDAVHFSFLHNGVA
jgi:hypothetical protein